MIQKFIISPFKVVLYGFFQMLQIILIINILLNMLELQQLYIGLFFS